MPERKLSRERLPDGARVSWVSQSGGYSRRKDGTVLTFLPAGRMNALVWLRHLRPGTAESRLKLTPSTYTSGVDRYLVEVERGAGKLPWYYAPLAGVLERQNATAGADSRVSRHGQRHEREGAEPPKQEG